MGDPRDPETEIGPLIGAASLERVGGLVDDARERGAEVVTGGEAEGACYRPTVLAGVTPEMRIYHEESFGPVVGVVSVDGPEEAVRVANDTEYGLAAAVFGEDVPTALDLARQIESGICHVNGATVHDEPQMPFGGVKASGFGRFGGKAGIDGVHRAALDHDPAGLAALPAVAARRRDMANVLQRLAALLAGTPGDPRSGLPTRGQRPPPSDGRLAARASPTSGTVGLRAALGPRAHGGRVPALRRRRRACDLAEIAERTFLRRVTGRRAAVGGASRLAGLARGLGPVVVRCGSAVRRAAWRSARRAALGPPRSGRR